MGKLKTIFILFAFLFMASFISGCARTENSSAKSLLNLSHLNHLYEDVFADGRSMAIVNIYSDYPDYNPVEAKGEGIACVDDAARAAVFYLRYSRLTGDRESQRKAKQLLEFLRFMQAPNGMFYNFVFRDLSINKTRHNSQARADWWTWRAVWALGEAVSYFRTSDPDYARQLGADLHRTFPAIDSLLQKYPEKSMSAGIVYPDWLPGGSAADQASELLMGLIPYYEVSGDSTVGRMISLLADGMQQMQAGDADNFPYGCLLTWQNEWHAWGSSQADMLLRAGSIMKRDDFVKSALITVEHFYPYLIKKNYLSQMSFRKNGNAVQLTESAPFPQIAYDIRPMVLASLEAYKVTGEARYAWQAGEIAGWLLGKNSSGQPLYDPATGRCYDGINNPGQINKNSGAESTIEALLTLLAVEQNPQAQAELLSHLRK
ncbi:MAG: hypothetical protein P8184_01845 [Calditrichia bacterium]